MVYLHDFYIIIPKISTSLFYDQSFKYGSFDNLYAVYYNNKIWLLYIFVKYDLGCKFKNRVVPEFVRYVHGLFLLAIFKLLNILVTADFPPERPPRASSQPSRPPPPRPQPPSAAPTAPTTVDFLNLTPQPGGQPPEYTQEVPKNEKKLKSNDSFDFFGMMEKPVDSFGDFLGGTTADNAEVLQLYSQTRPRNTRNIECI